MQLQVGDKVQVGTTFRKKITWVDATVYAVNKNNVTMQYANYRGGVSKADIISGEIKIREVGKKMNVESTNTASSKKSEKLTIDQLKELSKGYESQNKASVGISEKLGIGYSTVQKWFTEYKKQGEKFEFKKVYGQGAKDKKEDRQDVQSDKPIMSVSENKAIDNVSTLVDEKEGCNPSVSIDEKKKESIEKATAILTVSPKSESIFFEKFTTYQFQGMHIKKDDKGIRLYKNNGNNFLKFENVDELRDVAKSLLLVALDM